jgi:methionyl aminopeptidase
MTEKIPLRTREELKLMRHAGMIVGNTLAMLRERVAPGITTGQLDAWAREAVERYKGFPSFLQVEHPRTHIPFPGAICTSVNDEIVHGIPGTRVLQEGDIVSIDLGVVYKGYHADAAITVPVGRISDEAQRLIEVTEEALRRGIARVRPGNRLYDISEAIDSYATAKGVSIVRQYVGHGIGRSMWEPPQVPNFRMNARGPVLWPGMVLAIEPMLNLGGEETEVLPDQWTVVTADHSLSAHFEHTVAVTETGHQILTLPGDLGDGNV